MDVPSTGRLCCDFLCRVISMTMTESVAQQEEKRSHKHQGTIGYAPDLSVPLSCVHSSSEEQIFARAGYEPWAPLLHIVPATSVFQAHGNLLPQYVMA